MKRTHQILGYGLSAVAAAVSAQLHAQSAGLEEIVVTAQKRAESAQDIPIAIDVITGDTFVREGIRDLKDVGKLSTELEINFSASQVSVIGMRGMQTTGFAPTGDSLTAVHLDGAFLSSFYGLNGLMFDLERVEVLAGPQGTLYGRNSAAGAVNIITKRPGKDFEANGMVEYGSFDTVRLGGGVTVPMGDTFSVRLAGQKYTRDSFYNDGSGEQDQWSGRVSAQWTPTDRDTIFVSLDKMEMGGTSEATTLYKLNTDVRCTAVRVGCSAVGAVPASLTNYANLETLNDPYDVKAYYATLGQRYTALVDQTHWGVMGQYAHEFDGFTSTLQYSHRDLLSYNQSTYIPNSQFSPNFLTAAVVSDTAELRFTSSGDGAWQWVGGLFYVEATSDGWNATPAAATPGDDPFTGLDVDYCPCISGYYPNGGEMYSYAAFGQTTWTPPSMDRLHVTLGLRYTYDWKSGILASWVNSPVVPGGPAVPHPVFGFGTSAIVDQFPSFATVPDIDGGSNERNWDAVQYKLGAEYELTDTSMVYGSISTGYKSGGITFGPTPVIKPEDLLAFEIGTKNRFLGNTLQVNSSMWFYKYSDMEANLPRDFPSSVTYTDAQGAHPGCYLGPAGTPVCQTNSTASVGKVDMAGISADLDWLFTDADDIGISFTHTYSKIKDGQESGGAGATVFYVGQRVGDAPRWQTLARYGHTFTFADGATLNPQVKYQWQSQKYDGSVIVTPGAGCGTYNALCVTPGQTAVPSQGIMDLSLRFKPASDSWDITAYVNNVTDELNIRALTYTNNPANSATNYGHVTATLGEPRTYGVVLNARFK